MKSTSKIIRMPFEKYYTPHSVTRALAEVEYFQRIHDPAAGAGHIIDAFAALGVPGSGADLEPSRDDIPRADFLMMATEPVDADYVINPPYGPGGRLAVQFIERALECTRPTGRKVAALLHEDFDAGKTRRHLFAEHPAFARKYVLTNRIYWANLEQTDRSSTNHAWFVFDWLHRGPPTLHYIQGPNGEDFR